VLEPGFCRAARSPSPCACRIPPARNIVRFPFTQKLLGGRGPRTRRGAMAAAKTGRPDTTARIETDLANPGGARHDRENFNLAEAMADYGTPLLRDRKAGGIGAVGPLQPTEKIGVARSQAPFEAPIAHCALLTQGRDVTPPFCLLNFCGDARSFPPS